MRRLNERHLATVAAALRLRQAEMQCESAESASISAYITAAELDQIATGAGQFNALDIDEIETLCDSLAAGSYDSAGEYPEDAPAMKDVLQDAVDYLAEAFDETIDTEALVEWFSEWRQQAKRALSYAQMQSPAEFDDPSGHLDAPSAAVS